MVFKMNNSLVSIIIPVYNAQNHILETLNSIKEQTYNEYEIILVDDCSTDDSIEIIRNFKSDKLYLYRLNKNSGAAVARNYGINKAKGEYIAFIDSDDTWHTSKLEKQIEFMKNNDYIFTYTSINIIDANGNILKKSRKIIKKVKYKTILRNTVIATSTVVINRKKIGNFNMPLIRSGQDYATWLILLRSNATAYGIDEPLTNYRKLDSSLSSSKISNFKKVYLIQTKYEGISKHKAMINVMFYIINAIKKHYF